MYNHIDKKSLDIKALYTFIVEERELNTVEYDLQEHTKSDHTVTGHSAVLTFREGRYDPMFQLHLDDIEYLDEFIDLLTTLRSKWHHANQKAEAAKEA